MCRTSNIWMKHKEAGDIRRKSLLDKSYRICNTVHLSSYPYLLNVYTQEIPKMCGLLRISYGLSGRRTLHPPPYSMCRLKLEYVTSAILKI
jgi:hypothetical protein